MIVFGLLDVATLPFGHASAICAGVHQHVPNRGPSATVRRDDVPAGAPRLVGHPVPAQNPSHQLHAAASFMCTCSHDWAHSAVRPQHERVMRVTIIQAYKHHTRSYKHTSILQCRLETHVTQKGNGHNQTNPRQSPSASANLRE
jgi:hypothetical protein